MEVKLSARLHTIVEQIPTGSIIADIGSDHALLPVFALQQGIAKLAIAGEINDGPLRSAQKQIAEAGLEQQVIARKGDGLSVVSPGEVNVITIAGMGGATIESILERGLPQLAGVERLILQPNVFESAVRRWLLRHNWLLIDETILEEDGLFYEILTAVPAHSINGDLTNNKLYEPIHLGEHAVADKELQLLMGPYLLRKPTDVLQRKWLEEIAKRERVLAQMDLSPSAEAAQKRKLLGNETEKIKEVLSCLRTDKP